jgi:hypothetical protein
MKKPRGTMLARLFTLLFPFSQIKLRRVAR